MAVVNWSLQHFSDTAANMTANNPVLLEGQIGIETDGLTTTPKFKIGDGSTAWNTLPYFYGGASSAQNLNNVLGVGNTTGGLDLEVTDNDSLKIGTTGSRYIRYSSFTVNGGLELVNGTDHIILQDTGGIHIDTTKVILEQLTASRLLSLNASKEIVNETGTGFLKLNSGVISYDNSSYQPLDADLTSWAGVTRAAGFDTFVATPSSANLASLVTDETGSGALVFGTQPTFTTDITTPLIIGGSAAGSTIQYKGTSGNGTSTVAAHQFLVGNNGATTAAQVFNSGQVSIGNYASPTNLRLVTIGQDTAYMSFGSLVGTTSTAAIYFNQATPSATNYSIWGTSNATVINADSTVGSVLIRVNNTTVLNQDYNSVTFQPIAKSSLVTNFTFTVPANSNQAASTESPNFRISGNTKTWLTGAITTQRWNYFTANTAAFASASTITNSYGLYVEAATAGTNATITNNYALGLAVTGTGVGKYILGGSGGDGGTYYMGDVAANSPAMWLQKAAPSTTNYAFVGTSTTFSINGFPTLNLRSNGTTVLTVTDTTTITIADTVNFALNTGTGTKFATSTSQKLSFWNATPIVQPTTAVAAATFAANTSGIADDTATFDGYTIGQVVKALRNVGLLA